MFASELVTNASSYPECCRFESCRAHYLFMTTGGFMDISLFAWGFVVGVVAGPFAWTGAKWCYGKFTELVSG